MFIAALIMIARKWKEPRFPSTEEWIHKIRYICTMKNQSAIKKNEFVIFLDKWMDLQDIILSKVIQSQKNTYDMYLLIRGYQHRTLEYPRYKTQRIQNSRKRKTKVQILYPSLEWATKYPCKELQRQSLELRWKEGPCRDCPTQEFIP